MYLVRRVCRTAPGKARDVAAVLDKICAAYEKNGRSKATIYMGMLGGDTDVVYCEWMQDSIKPATADEIPASVYTDDAEMRPHLLSYDLEVFEGFAR
jgi:RNase adaptor protein for sRNA GlmZ degradation